MENRVEFSKILSSFQKIEFFHVFLAVEFFRKRTKKKAWHSYTLLAKWKSEQMNSG